MMEKTFRMKTSRAALAAAGAGLALLGAAGCNRPNPTVAVRRDIVAHMVLNAAVVAPPDAQAAVYPPYRTTVKRIRAGVNDHVRRGEVIMELTIPSAEQAVAAARQSLQDAEAAYEGARANANQSIASARQRMASAHAAAQNSGSSADQGAAATDAAGAAAPSGGTTPAADDRPAAREALAAAEAQAAADLAPARQQLEDARHALREAQAGRAQGLVRAPISGTVTNLAAQVGQMVGDDRKVPLATIVNMDRLQIKAPLAADQVPYVKEGMPVKLTSPSFPNQQLAAEVSDIVSTADPKTGETIYSAVLSVKGPDEKLLRPNEQLSAAVKLGVAENVVAVPNSAIKKRNGAQAVVEVRRGSDWVEVPVELGLTDGQYTEIKQGVQVGEVIKATEPMLGSR